jgi:hypothetical protein
MAPLTGIALANNWLINKLKESATPVKTPRMTTNSDGLRKSGMSVPRHVMILTILFPENEALLLKLPNRLIGLTVRTGGAPKAFPFSMVLTLLKPLFLRHVPRWDAQHYLQDLASYAHCSC